MKADVITSGNDFLINPINAHRAGRYILNTGITANADGRMIIPNGTPIGAATSLLESDQTQGVVASSANVQGLLYAPFGLDVTSGGATGSIVFRGIVDIKQLPATVNTAIKEALVPAIMFQEGR